MAGIDRTSNGRAVRARRARYYSVAMGLAALAAVVGLRWLDAPRQAIAKGPFSAKEKPAATAGATDQGGAAARADKSSQIQVVAVVNSTEISRNELAARCVRYYGETVLISLINKQIIAQHCKQQSIVITGKDVQAEIERIAKRFKLPVDRLLSMLLEERKITPAQYANEIIWPNLALRRLAAAEDLQVTPEEIALAHETRYGPSVSVRLIACDSMNEAQDLHKRVLAKPRDFPIFARRHSVDVNSAAANGRIQPIRMHSGDPQLEKAAFSLKEGQISKIMQVGQQFVFIKVEQHLPDRNVPLATVEQELREAVEEKKERESAHTVFEKLESQAVVVDVYNDPAKRKQHPGVAAIVNNVKITVGQLGEACVDRHGEEVLEGLITRRVLEQACQKKKLSVTKADVQDEIARAALAAGQADKAGHADIDGWLKMVTEEQGISEETYVSDVVWPTVALKKLAGGQANVTETDLQKGFEANYGERVRCLAIVLDNQRRAQEVWEKARAKNNSEFFGDLAAAYSIEPGAMHLRGEVPPIQRHGGQPILEKEAFALEPGELSGIIQVGSHFVILRCEGRTEPKDIKLDEVRNVLFADLHEKKLRLEMARRMDSIYDAAEIDNYLAGTIQQPKTDAQQPGDSLRKVPLDNVPLNATRPATGGPKRR